VDGNSAGRLLRSMWQSSNEEYDVVRIPFVLWWGANLGCESPSETHANKLSQAEFAPHHRTKGIRTTSYSPLEDCHMLRNNLPALFPST